MPNTYNIKVPTDWNKVEPGEIIGFDCYNKTRAVALGINANARVDVYLSFFEDMRDAVLLASDDHMFDVAYTTAIDTYLQFVAPKDTAIFVRSPAYQHLVPKVDQPSFAQPLPQRQRSNEMDQIMQLIRRSEQKRNQDMQAAIARIEAERKAERDERRAERIAEKEAAEAAAKKGEQNEPVSTDEPHDQKA